MKTSPISRSLSTMGMWRNPRVGNHRLVVIRDCLRASPSAVMVQCARPSTARSICDLIGSAAAAVILVASA
jgi:hypothetical protein